MCFPPLHFLKGEMCWGEISLHTVHKSSTVEEESIPALQNMRGPDKKKKTLHGGSQQLTPPDVPTCC